MPTIGSLVLTDPYADLAWNTVWDQRGGDGVSGSSHGDYTGGPQAGVRPLAQSNQYVLFATDPKTGQKAMIVSYDGGPVYAPPGYDAAANAKLAKSKWSPTWFRDQVKSKGDWDYKQLDPLYEHLGNFNYGLTGKAFGFTDGQLYRNAGAAQIAAGTSRPEWGTPGNTIFGIGGAGFFGDDPRDQAMIRAGIDAYRNGLVITTERVASFAMPVWPPLKN